MALKNIVQLNPETEAETNHYIGNAGIEYFKRQNKGGIDIGIIEARKFSPYIIKGDTVLDFGCGGGHTLEVLNCARKIGIEINPEARKYAEKYGFPVYEDLSSIKKESVNKVISNHCLEHVSNPIEILKQIKNCLVMGGQFILCVPINDWRLEKHYSKDSKNCHLYTWTPQLLGNCLTEAGFEIKSIQIYTHAWPPGVFYLNKLLSVWLFDVICNITSIVFNTRQIIAIATKR